MQVASKQTNLYVYNNVRIATGTPITGRFSEILPRSPCITRLKKRIIVYKAFFLFFIMFVISVFTTIVSLLWLTQFWIKKSNLPIVTFLNIIFIMVWVLLCGIYVRMRCSRCRRDPLLYKSLLA